MRINILKDKILISLLFSQIASILVPKLIIFQACIVLLIGIFHSKKANGNKCVFILSFITGSETYYKQAAYDGISESIIPWEFPKYAAIIIGLFLILNNLNMKRSFSFSLFIFLILSLFSFIFTLYMDVFTIQSTYKLFATGLTNLLALFAICFSFDSVNISIKDIKKIILYYGVGILPTLIMLGVNFGNIAQINFTAESNNDFSGYGPIHVSTAIGLLMGFLFFGLKIYNFWHNKFLVYITLVILMIFMLLTFSRSGIAMVVPSFLIAYIFFKRKISIIIPILFFWLIIKFALTPYLNSLTQGAFTVRYSEVVPSSRVDIARSDLLFWSESPIFGIGLDRARKNFRFDLGTSGIAAHTEYTRFLAEQGLIGLLSMMLLFSIFLRRLLLERHNIFMPFLLYCILFSLLYFSASAFRTVLPAFVLGLSLTSYKNINSSQNKKNNAITYYK